MSYESMMVLLTFGIFLVSLIRLIVLIPRQKFALQTFATPLERGIATPRFANDLIGVAIAIIRDKKR